MPWRNVLFWKIWYLPVTFVLDWCMPAFITLILGTTSKRLCPALVLRWQYLYEDFITMLIPTIWIQQIAMTECTFLKDMTAACFFCVGVMHDRFYHFYIAYNSWIFGGGSYLFGCVLSSLLEGETAMSWLIWHELYTHNILVSWTLIGSHLLFFWASFWHEKKSLNVFFSKVRNQEYIVSDTINVFSTLSCLVPPSSEFYQKEWTSALLRIFHPSSSTTESYTSACHWYRPWQNWS